MDGVSVKAVSAGLYTSQCRGRCCRTAVECTGCPVSGASKTRLVTPIGAARPARGGVHQGRAVAPLFLSAAASRHVPPQWGEADRPRSPCNAAVSVLSGLCTRTFCTQRVLALSAV